MYHIQYLIFSRDFDSSRFDFSFFPTDKYGFIIIDNSFVSPVGQSLVFNHIIVKIVMLICGFQ